jgi:hypothetical protein
MISLAYKTKQNKSSSMGKNNKIKCMIIFLVENRRERCGRSSDV